MIEVIKGSAINRLSLTTQFGTLSIPGALLEGIAFVTSDLFTISIIKCKLLTSRKTFRSKSVCMKNEVPKQLLSVVLGPSERLTWRSVLYVFNANQVSNNFFVSLPLSPSWSSLIRGPYLRMLLFSKQPKHGKKFITPFIWLKGNSRIGQHFSEKPYKRFSHWNTTKKYIFSDLFDSEIEIQSVKFAAYSNFCH